MLSRAELLGQLMTNYKTPVAISGTHGKTTTTSMLSHIALAADLDPTISVGGILKAIEGNIRVGGPDLFITEACEYTNSFLHFFPKIGIILNVDADHLDFFKDLDDIRNSFHLFAKLLPENGTLVINGDIDKIEEITSDLSCRVITFGKEASLDYSAANITYNEQGNASFDVVKDGQNVAHLALAVGGEHNVYNSLAVIAAAMLTGADFEQCVKGIEDFHGAGRRFEKLAEIDGITIADDYAHHPRELEVTLKTAMNMGYRKVWAVFQPFTYSRTAILFDDFVRVLQIPDHCIMTEIMGSREVNTYDIYTSQLAEKIPGSVWFNTFEEVAQYAVDHAESGDLIITLGCGDIYKAAKIMINKLKERAAE